MKPVRVIAVIGWFAALVVAALAAACASGRTSPAPIVPDKPAMTTDQKAAWSRMVGRWYGSQPTEKGGHMDWLVERAPEGVYQITFRVHDRDGTVTDRVEVGEWGVSGPIYFSIYRAYVTDGRLIPSNPADPYNYDAYQIIRLTDDTFEYQSVTSGAHYTIRRVGPDFELPE